MTHEQFKAAYDKGLKDGRAESRLRRLIELFKSDLEDLEAELKREDWDVIGHTALTSKIDAFLYIISKMEDESN